MTSTITNLHRHNCDKSHRKPRKFVNCAIPDVGSITGDGLFAVVAWCNSPSRRVPRGPSVSLWETEDQALMTLANLPACGGCCEGKHEVVRLVIR